MNIKQKVAALFAAFVVFVCPVMADKTPVENLYHYTLDNGLTLFVNENHSVPLVYIEIAVRAGATTQTPETAGLFHLYEHMMFKGNALYPDAASVQKAISDLGVAEWNGTTSTDHVNYFFTIPAEELESGLAFWNAAVRTPSMDPREFEAEKEVVLAEIVGDASDPIHQYFEFRSLELFPDAPYRTSAGGSIPAVQNATIAQMREMQNTYYIPANSALFVGGDINPDEVYKLVNEIYGDWSNNGKSAPAKAPQQNTNPFDEVEYCIMPYDQLPPFYAEVDVLWRGPDTDYDIADTYPADVICSFTGDPEGLFLQTVVGDEDLGIPDYDYAWGSYGTSCAAGVFDFGAIMLYPDQALPARVDKFISDVQDIVLPGIANDKDNFSKKKMAELAQQLKDSDTKTAETASGLLSNLRFWWICSSPEYYFTYNDKLASVTQKDMQNFVSKYFEGKKPLVVILINPDTYAQCKEEFDAAGYYEIGSEDKTWWKMEKFAPDPSKIAQEVPETEVTPIYKPTGKKSEASKKESEVKVYKLKNGIPVYVKADKTAKIDTVSIGVKGGISHVTTETSGLESALFNMMSKSSKEYSQYDHQTLNYNYGISVANMSKISGSALCVSSLHSYFDKALPVLVDGFLNPVFDEEVYTNMMNDYMNNVQSELNDPSSLLDYTMMKDVYAGHPYETEASVTPESVGNITIEGMEALHKDILNPSEIFVVAVGNIDAKKLVKELNKSIGKMKSNGKPAYVAAEVPLLEVKEEKPVVLTHPAVANSGYVARIFAGAPNTSDEFIPMALAADMYSGVLFNVVRTRYGACYTPYSYSIGSKAPYGMEYLYNLADFANFDKYMAEARNYMASNQLIEAANPDGTYTFSTVEARLNSYKNKFINSTYASQATSTSVCLNLTYNVMHYEDINHDAKVMAALEATTAEDVLRVFNKYWIEGPSRWYLIVGPEDVSKLQGDFAQ